jgi:hypothetical protein
MSILVFFVGSIASAIFVPAAMKRAHVRSQNRLLDRCRALYVLAVQAVEFANEATARSYLARIRRIEARWRFGNRNFFRVAFAFWAIGVGIVGFTILRALSFVAFDARLPAPYSAKSVRSMVEGPARSRPNGRKPNPLNP